MTDFAPGDIVRLKSGGPKMTVLSLENGSVTCKWFDRNGKLHTDEFAAVLLETFISKIMK